MNENTIRNIVISIGIISVIFFFAFIHINSWKYTEPIINAKSNDIISILILPLYAKRNHAPPNLVLRSVAVTQAGVIRNICNALNNSKKWSPRHPTVIWTCFLIINTKNASYDCVVEKTFNNGVLIRVYTNGS